MEDFFDELEDEDFDAMYEELQTAIGAYETFMTSVTGNAEFNAAIAQIMVLTLTGDDDTTPYNDWITA